MYNEPSCRNSCRTPEPGSLPSTCTVSLESLLKVCQRAASGPASAFFGAMMTFRALENRCSPAFRKASSSKESGAKPKNGSNSKLATKVDRPTTWVRCCSMTTRLAEFIGRLTREPAGGVVANRCKSPNLAGALKNAMRVFFRGSGGTMQTLRWASNAPCWTCSWYRPRP
nr:hypothetical protein [uncultured bacterium]